MLNVGRIARVVLPYGLYSWLRATKGDYQYQERAGRLNPPWTAYGLLMAVRAAQKYGISSISVAEFGVANGRGLRRMVNLAEQLKSHTGINVRVYGFDTGSGLPTVSDYRDHPELFREGDYPMQNFNALRAELKGRAKLVIGDVREIHDLGSVFDDASPLGFASIDVDIYSSARSILDLLSKIPESLLLPTVQLHFDDVWSEWGYNKFAGELLAIEEFNTLVDNRKIDNDRYVDYWHKGHEPWHASMFMLHVLDHSLRFRSNSDGPKVISE